MENTQEAVLAVGNATSWGRAFIVLLVMCISGILGSYCRQIWDKDTVKINEKSWIWPGIAAALVVPLFLSVGGNSVFSKTLSAANNSDTIQSLFLIAGFCILAGVAAPSFVSALAQRALSVAKEADRKAERAENLGEAAIESAENVGQEKQIGPSEQIKTRVSELTDQNQKLVMNSLINSEYSWRAVGGIASATGLDRSTVRTALGELKAMGMVVDKQSTRSAGMLYQPRV